MTTIISSALCFFRCSAPGDSHHFVFPACAQVADNYLLLRALAVGPLQGSNCQFTLAASLVLRPALRHALHTDLPAHPRNGGRQPHGPFPCLPAGRRLHTGRCHRSDANPREVVPGRGGLLSELPQHYARAGRGGSLLHAQGHHQGLRVDVDADLPHGRQCHRAGSGSRGAMTRLLASAAGAAALALDNPGPAACPEALDPCPDRSHRLAEEAGPNPRIRLDRHQLITEETMTNAT
ncbi:uncharacterized protein LOC108050275 isoform X3 [Drosophila rhopaloa]|uniref:Uncharacterized protein n=1 Tax=Drosophila rhopaloa TaxID=1041015 RepID=A0ABM5J8I4_DRORH|nr:uncharacterized protein LOC108050275 isoform X3 [Drosophila rhopaloa]